MGEIHDGEFSATTHIHAKTRDKIGTVNFRGRNPIRPELRRIAHIEIDRHAAMTRDQSGAV